MPDEVKQQLDGLGIRIVQTWHIVLLIAGMILALGATWGDANARIAALEHKVVSVELEVKEMHQTEVDLSRVEAKLDMLIKEIKRWK